MEASVVTSPTLIDNLTSVVSPASMFDVEVPLLSRVFTLIAGSVSILCSLLIIFTYILWKDLQTMSRHLLLCLSIMDLIVASSLLYGVIRDFQANTFECRVQSMLSTFAETSTFFWTLSIAVYLYITIVKTNVELANKLCAVYHLVSWGVPAVCIGVVVSFGGLGWDHSNTTVGWCWVNLQDEYAVLWMLLVGKLWELLACVTLPVLCVLIKLHIHREVNTPIDY